MNLAQSIQGAIGNNIKDIVTGAVGLGFKPWVGQLGQSVTTAAMFLPSCIG